MARRGNPRYNVKDVVERHKPQQVAKVAFGMLSGPEMARLASVKIVSKNLYTMPTRKPAQFGSLDPRLGVSNKTDLCWTCQQRQKECAGHYGVVKLELPVYHVGFFKATLAVLQCVCKQCSRVLLLEKARKKHSAFMTDPRIDVIQKVKRFKAIVEECGKVKSCELCGAANGPVKKIVGAPLKIGHDVYSFKNEGKETDAGKALKKDLAEATAFNADIGTHLKHTKHIISPLEALLIMKRIPACDLDLLWVSEHSGRPECLILTHILVPPVAIRPSVAMDAGAFNEDDLTVKLQEIVGMNGSLAEALARGQHMRGIMENWDHLQTLVANYINGDLPTAAGAARPKKPIRGLCQRLKGKAGRFRQNLLGKRVDFSGRTVISPDPNLRLHEVGVPRAVANILTYPEVVTDANMPRLQDAVRMGPNYPGAHSVRQRNGRVKNLEYGNRNVTAEQLQVGDVVERHMVDGDVVLFNRQPSLHKMSIMSHRARVMSSRTFRFNECVCPPYNADFDGDEMNLHLPQTEEARAEAANLMDVRFNMVTPRSGEPLITANQDFLTAAFLITQRRVFLTRDQFCQAVSWFADGNEQVDIPTPAVLKPVPLWTGKQVMSAMLCPSAATAKRVTLSLRERNYDDTSNSHKAGFPCMCPAEGFVVIRNGELLAGNWGKNTLGGGKRGLVNIMIRDVSAVAAAEMLHRLTKVCIRWLTDFGFSIGIDDVTPTHDLNLLKHDMVQEGYRECEDKIAQFSAGTLERLAGCDLEETLENHMNGILGRLRNKVGDLCKRQLPPFNSALVMESCGSKGSALNICQMIACVGQQAVNGARIPEGFVNRTLPHFPKQAKEPAARGFVANSFFTGLIAQEFFFHTMGGREGLVDTAVKTAQTGYMQRRMVKAMEDLCVQYDGTVRSSNGNVYQFRYGDDGLDPSFMENNKRPMDLARLLGVIKAAMPSIPMEEMLPPQKILAFAKAKYAELRVLFRRQFSQEMGAFFVGVADTMVKAIGAVGLTVDDPDVVVDFAPGSAWRAAAAATSVSEDAVDASLGILRKTVGVSHVLLQRLFVEAKTRYCAARIDPGEAVGVAAAHSLGEPATQMTLKTFHFAGVATMNVTLGVPRITEIINANMKISTPVIDACLLNSRSEPAARMVKASIERTKLGDIATYFKEVYSMQRCALEVKLDTGAIEALHLNITVDAICDAVRNGCKPKLAEELVVPLSADRLVVFPPNTGFYNNARPKATGTEPNAFSSLLGLRQYLPGVVVKGVPNVDRAVISRKENTDDSHPEFHLLVEGGSLLHIMGVDGVDGRHCTSNHVMEVEETLGIEAARKVITTEIMQTYNNYGISLDVRHLSILADTMTSTGQVLGITRFGIEKMKESVLGNASFEKTPDHLFNAAVHSRVDNITGVSACIVMGVPIELGTGSFKLLQASKPCKLRKPASLFLA